MTDEPPKTAEPSPGPRPPRRNTLWLALGGVGLVFVGLRAFYCDTYKIPAASMMPTLHSGDHIYTSKLAYGVFEDSPPARGDVIVFEYPLNRREDFIKRVIGLPGDEVRLSGQEVAIKRAGATDFEPLARERISQPCEGEGGGIARNCTMYTETVDERSYGVEYYDSGDADLFPTPRTFVVPAGQLFVLGDNRSRSHDSPAWADPETDEPRPFVPLDHVKGRAERIWLPFSRFWQPVR